MIEILKYLGDKSGIIRRGKGTPRRKKEKGRRNGKERKNKRDKRREKEKIAETLKL